MIHAVDVSNPRWPQQIQSVKRILSELKLADIPTVLALNKADLIDQDSLHGIVRHASQLDAGEVVVISAINPSSLGVLLEKAGSVLARNLAAEPLQKDSRQSATLSQFA